MRISINKTEKILLVLALFFALIQEELYSLSTTAIVFIPLYIVLTLMLVLYLLDVYISFRRTGKLRTLVKDKWYIIFWLVFLLFAIFSIMWSTHNLYNIMQRLLVYSESILILIIANVYIDLRWYVVITKFLYIMLIVDIALTFQQNMLWGLYEDFCNGFFGYTGYGSGAVGVFCVAISIVAIVNYNYKLWGTMKSLLVILLTSVICALAEVKIYYILFIVALILFFILDGVSLKVILRNITIALGVAVLFYIAYEILKIIFPYNLQAMFSVDAYLAYDSRSIYAGRTNTIPFILNTLFYGKKLSSIFGTGLGSNSANYIYELGKTFSDLGFAGVTILGSILVYPLINWIINKKNRTSQLLFKSIFSISLIVSIVVWNAPFVRSLNILVFLLLGIPTEIDCDIKKIPEE